MDRPRIWRDENDVLHKAWDTESAEIAAGEAKERLAERIAATRVPKRTFLDRCADFFRRIGLLTDGRRSTVDGR